MGIQNLDFIHERFKQVMSLMGGEHSELFQSSFWFPKTRQLLTLYVDDIVLSGLRGHSACFLGGNFNGT